MTLERSILHPVWPAPASVRALSTTRLGGASAPPFESLNLGTHVGDADAAVLANRQRLRALLPAEPMWLQQVHGSDVARCAPGVAPICADASVSGEVAGVCAVLTADCLPVLFCDRAGTVVAAAHAGWRGLAAGVLENTVRAMGVSPESVIAWLGPAIGPAAFEVGDEVREAFVRADAHAESAFERGRCAGKWMADLYRLARLRLASVGVSGTFGGELCTFSDPARFFSFRRDGRTGRQASLIWLDNVG